MAITYHGASRVSPNQFTVQDVSAKVNVRVDKIKRSFFMSLFLSALKTKFPTGINGDRYFVIKVNICAFISEKYFLKLRKEQQAQALSTKLYPIFPFFQLRK